MTQTRAAMLSLICTGIAFAGGEGWTTDFEAAKKEAAESKKSLLVDFTGSDWCGWCIKLNDEVFKHDTFKTGVKDKFVLVELDYPNDKSKQSEALQKQNAELAEKYSIQGFPTILLTDEQGRPFASTGYEPGGPVDYVKHLDGLLEKRKARDEGFAAAGKLEGPAKAKALIEVLDTMELDDAAVTGFYASTIDDIKKSDPEDVSGYVKKAEVKARMAKFNTGLGELVQKQDFAGAMALVDKTFKEDGFSPEDKQHITAMKAVVLAQQGKFDDALKVVDEAKAIAPNSTVSEKLDGFKEQLEKAKSEGKPE